ncbi:MAG: ATP-binding protein [Proteobacteria bacterium]|nr:ATP-binding protein [Pseudomonadota bacterium]
MNKTYYATSSQHILAELERVDILIRTQVSRARQLQQVNHEFQGLCISEQEVDALLKRPSGLPRWLNEPVPSFLDKAKLLLDRKGKEIAQRKAESKLRGITLRLDELAHIFGLSVFEVDALMICLAPELDLRYERLYAYLQDDVTKKRPSIDLVLNLLSSSFEDKLAARKHFAAGAPLSKNYLLHLFDNPSHQNSPLLSKFLKLDDRIVGYLLGENNIDFPLNSFAQYIAPQIHLKDLILPTAVIDYLSLLATEKDIKSNAWILYFQGKYGVGKQSTAEALCNRLGMGLLVVDGEHLLDSEEVSFEKKIRLVIREASLLSSATYWNGFDALLAEDKRTSLDLLLDELAVRRELTFLSGNKSWEPRDVLYHRSFIPIEFPIPSYNGRLELWGKSLNGRHPVEPDVDLTDLANKFHFSGGQIRDAAETAKNRTLLRSFESRQISMNDLYIACRSHSNRKLTTLSQKIEPKYTWEDIVLPNDQMSQLREITNHVQYKHLVYGEWGFDRKISLGKGLNILFHGPSGTGKTMGSEIIANELKLDLYKIDLSTVVSKYIGETEKNLSKIFKEAETSNAILFFDEADALFGKRSEVRDSHDRYANIEIGYLLQKMDEYTGVVILATNMKKNMDEAFVRRMHFSVEFPFPDEGQSLRIWQNIFPQETPLSNNIEFNFMASKFKFSGGNIKNTALTAAFYAANDGQAVTMEHLIQATKREFQKMGKLCVKADFERYYDLVQKSS